MSKIDIEVIEKLTQLCRIDCTQDELNSLLSDLQKIVGYMELLQEVDTENVKPCNHVLEEIVNVFRADEVGNTLSRDVFLENAPMQIGGMVRVPTVIKQH